MKLNILSDLHLGHGGLDYPQNAADVVILAGDIARPREAVEWALGLRKPVLYVAGNHEFYGSTLARTRTELKALCAGTAIHVLDDDAVTIGGVRFLGTTLWTDFMLLGEGAERTAAIGESLRFIRDFSRIGVGDDDGSVVLFSPEESAVLHHRHAGWLAARLAEAHPGPTVVITHHAPSPGSIHPRFEGSLLNVCFASNAEHLLDGGRAQLWVHGHMHDSFDYSVNGTRVVCNPRGYASNGVNENARFDPDFTVDIG